MKRSLSHCLSTAALALAFTLTFSCSSDGSSGGRGGGLGSKGTCISDGLQESALTLGDIMDDCNASSRDILSLLPDDIGSCSKADFVLDLGKPIGEIMSDCGVEEIPFASSSSGGKTVGRSSSSDGGNPDPDPSSSSDGGNPDPDPSSSGGNDGGDSSPSADIVYGTPVEHGGETYKTVVIGEQTWMARNLNVMHNTDYGYSYCYDDDPANCAEYGRLYNWAAAMNLPSGCNSSYCSSQINTPHQGLCPKDFHVPTNADWDKLMRFVDGNTGTSSPYSPYDSYTAGKYLKATSGWNSYNGVSGNGTDKYGFSALPGGGYYYYSNGSYSNAGSYGIWWKFYEAADLQII